MKHKLAVTGMTIIGITFAHKYLAFIDVSIDTTPILLLTGVALGIPEILRRDKNVNR